MKMAQSLKYSVIFGKMNFIQAIENETSKQKGRFLCILLVH